jgi:predicted acylesterase/phospholipase RssA
VAGIDLSKKTKVAFVCSGGAVKAAAFHVGVALALEHNGFRFLGGTHENSDESPTLDPSRTVQVYVGSSAGSLVSTFLAQGGKLKELLASFRDEPSVQSVPGLKYWEMLYPRVRSRLELFSFDNFLLNMLRNRTLQSPFSTQGIARYLRTHVIKSDRFSELEADLFVVATEVNQSRKVVFGKYKSAPPEPHLEYRNDVSVSDACAASMALPPVYHPYSIQIDGQRRDYFDGEIREPLSSHVARDMDCDLIICSYTHQPIRVPPGKESLADRGIQQVTLQAIYQAIEQKIQSSRGTRQREKALIDKVHRFFKEKNLPQELCDELVQELEARMSYKANVDYIYIRPKATDAEMFLLPHFSLKRAKTERIVRTGFIAARSALRSLKTESA